MNRSNLPIHHPSLLIFWESFHLFLELIYHQLNFIDLVFRSFTLKFLNFVFLRLKQEAKKDYNFHSIFERLIEFYLIINLGAGYIY